MMYKMSIDSNAYSQPKHNNEIFPSYFYANLNLHVAEN